MAAAGFGPRNPLEFELRLNASDSRRRVALALAAMWSELGVDTRLVTSEDRARMSDMRYGRFEAVMSLRLTAARDAFTFLHPFSGRAGGMNTTRYRNPRYDEWLEQAEQEVDLDARAELLRRAERELLRDQPVAPIYVYTSKMLVSPRVRGWIDNARGSNASRYLRID